MNVLTDFKKDISTLANPQKAANAAWFFKTKIGEYGYGDKFHGLTVPEQRILAKKYKDLSIDDISKLLQSGFHEERLIALFILVDQFKKSDPKRKKELFEFYIANTPYINNWDLVDSSAHKIVGAYLFDKADTSLLNTFAKSPVLWERRIAVISTFYFISRGVYAEALQIAEQLLHDKQDLIHKAVGWMLREVGKRCSQEAEEEFLRKHYKTMPRTMLRYAIEHFSEAKRKAYLRGNI